MTFAFKKATRHKLPLRLAIEGPSGSGKTLSALRFARALGKRIAVVDTENKSASKYVNMTIDGEPIEFDVLELSKYDPPSYTAAIMLAIKEKYDVVIVDSLSHAWQGEGGALDLVDKKAAESNGNKFSSGWRDVTPMHNRMIDSIVHSPAHMIVTMRTQTEYVMEENEKGKKVPKKIGMKPIQRAGVEYEFDIVCDMDLDHVLKVSKTRCPAVDGATAVKPGPEFIQPVIDWLNDGGEVPADYYCATEDDLAKLEKQRMSSLSPTEKAKAAAEKAKAKAQTNGAAKPSTNGSAKKLVAPQLVSDGLAETIRSAWAEAYSTPEEFAAALASYGVKLIAELTQAQAEHLHAAMLARLDTDGGNAADGADAKQPAQTAEPAEPPSPLNPNDPSTQEQRDRIKDLCELIGVTHDEQVEICKARKVNSFRSFSVSQAAELIERMEAEAANLEPAASQGGDDDIPF